jgi:hypothetical protein
LAEPKRMGALGETPVAASWPVLETVMIRVKSWLRQTEAGASDACGMDRAAGSSGVWVEVGEEVKVMVEVRVAVLVGVWLRVGLPVSVSEAVALGVMVPVTVRVELGVQVGVAVEMGVWVDVGEKVGVMVNVGKQDRFCTLMLLEGKMPVFKPLP